MAEPFSEASGNAGNHAGRDPLPWLEFAGLLLIVGALLATSWRRTAHFLVDFGRELYVPWQITEGQRLYVDLAYFNGPLSPHFNATLFRLFGVSVTTLMIVNVVILLLVLTLIYLGLSRLGGPLSRFLGAALFLAVFALSDLYHFGNYNFVTPYSHEITHGFLLALVTLMLLTRYRDDPRIRWLAATALALGLVFLTKAEIFLATAGAVLFGLAFETWDRRRPVGETVKRGALFGLVALTPPVLALVALTLSSGAEVAFRGVLGSWLHLRDGNLSELRFYKFYLGTLDLPNSLLRTAVWSVYYLVAFGPVYFVARRITPGNRLRLLLAGLIAVWVAAFTILTLNTLDPDDLLRPLPWLLVIVGVLLMRQENSPRQRLYLVVVAFAFLLLAKIFFFTRLHHYGFVLAVPAFLVLVLVLLWDLPRRIDRGGGWGKAFQVGALTLLAILAAEVVRISVYGYNRANVQLGKGADRLWVAEKGELVVRAIDWLEANTAPDSTLAVFPEGAMINYQSRRANSAPYFTILPPEVLMFGEATMLAAYQADPPDYVAVIKRTTREYGFTAFGEGYADSIEDWVQRDYHVVHSIIEPEFEPDYSRIFILQRK
jgi:4-amino-4-deoxy-L-arabinose transferase-like glycosyltransferase